MNRDRMRLLLTLPRNGRSMPLTYGKDAPKGHKNASELTGESVWGATYGTWQKGPRILFSMCEAWTY
jgi:hypothetical protein